MDLRSWVAREDVLTRQMNVHVCIGDPSTESAVRKLLAANPDVRVTPWRAEHLARDPLAQDIGSDLRDGKHFADIDVLLLGSEDLSRLEENEPGSVNELQRRVKVLLLLESENMAHSLELLRHCDGMIVRDVNLGNISDIIALALHGYFVIPCKLMADFKLVSAPTRTAIVEEIGSRENGASTTGVRDFSRDISAQEYCATRTTMRSAIRNVLKRRKNGARARLDVAEAARAGDEPDPAPAEGDAVRPAGWRRALRDNGGRVTAGECVLMLAALAIWGAIIVEAGGPKTFVKMFERCPSTADSVQCGVIANAPMGRSAASMEVTAKGPFGPGGAFKRPVDGVKDPEK